MCVAIYKPRGVETPSLDTLRKCWDTNPDGGGFAMRIENKSKYSFQICKGFMTWDEFCKAYEDYKLASFNDDLFLHFRIATHGGVCPGNTHPFPITCNHKELKDTTFMCNSVLMHNGVLPIKPDCNDISDTMQLCKILYSLKGKTSEAIDLLSHFVAGNKIAIMLPKDKVRLIGAWQVVNNVYYSNLNWQMERNIFSWQKKSTLMPLDDTWDKDDPWEKYERSVHCEYDDCIKTATSVEEDYLLNDGICPYCENFVDETEDGFFCPECGMTWLIESYEEEESQQKKTSKQKNFLGFFNNHCQK